MRKLNGITVEEVAAQLGLGRTAGYQAVRKQQIPARRLPNSDRWIVPEDVVAQMEAYDLGNLPLAPLSEDRFPASSPDNEVEESATDDEAAGEGIDP